MKKIIAALSILLSTSIFAANVANTLNTAQIGTPSFEIKKNWNLTNWNYAFFIENPNHSLLNFEFEIAPISIDIHGRPVQSAA